MIFISSNHFSGDLQARDALDYLRLNHIEAYCEVRKHFPETFVFGEYSGWFDTDAMGVDEEYGSWLCDAIENTGIITWWEGEPVVLEEGDELD